MMKNARTHRTPRTPRTPSQCRPKQSVTAYFHSRRLLPFSLVYANVCIFSSGVFCCCHRVAPPVSMSNEMKVVWESQEKLNPQRKSQIMEKLLSDFDVFRLKATNIPQQQQMRCLNNLLLRLFWWIVAYFDHWISF